MLTKDKIREIIKESNLAVLFSEREIEAVVEDLYARYGTERSTEKSKYPRGQVYTQKNLDL